MCVWLNGFNRLRIRFRRWIVCVNTSSRDFFLKKLTSGKVSKIHSLTCHEAGPSGRAV